MQTNIQIIQGSIQHYKARISKECTISMQRISKNILGMHNKYAENIQEYPRSIQQQRVNVWQYTHHDIALPVSGTTSVGLGLPPAESPSPPPQGATVRRRQETHGS